MNQTLTVVTLGILAGCTAPEPAPIPEDWNLVQRLAYVDQLEQQWEADGASGMVYISLSGNTLYEQGFGSASCDSMEAITPDHHFMIGSITKEITQLLAYVLAERGQLELDAELRRYFPQLGNDVGDVTVQQLIDHTAGLPDLIDSNGRPVRYRVEYDYEPVGRDALIARAGLAELDYEPGSREEYSNLGYQLLAALLEVASGLSFEELLRRNIYEPADMADTEYWFSDFTEREFADGCQRNNARWGNPVDDRMWGPDGASWNLKGAGGLISTAESLCHFFEGIGQGVYFETAAGTETYKSARMPFSQTRQQRTMGPAGSNGIFNAVSVWFDNDRFCLTMFTNRARYQAEDDMVQQIIRIFAPSFMATL